MTVPHGGGAVVEWLADRRRRSGLVVERILVDDCRGWLIDDRKWRHETGGFFSIVGMRWFTNIPNLQGFEAPMIAQPETGVLGLIVRRRGEGLEWLLQGKTEPGTVSCTQIGPTVQATESNYRRVHGGLATPFVDMFLTPPPEVRMLADVAQSEQGYCFLGKYNRNAVLEVGEAFTPPDQPNWAWFSSAQLTGALSADFTVNTDTRSVLTCMDWNLVGHDGGAFARWRGQRGFGEALLDSFESSRQTDHLVAELNARRASTDTRIELTRLCELRGWTVEARGILPASDDGSQSVQAFAIQASDREVSSWCQPLMVGSGEGRVALVCAAESGKLRFLLRFGAEPGFLERVQFAPSVISDPRYPQIEWMAEALADAETVVHASVLQSDEGGRFANSIARYEIVEIQQRWANRPVDDGLWVTLAELKAMTSMPGLLTNETRSALSLLLTWV